MALIAYFIGLVTHDPPATLPMRLVVLLLAAGDAALIRCLLLPERPQAELDRLRRAIHAGIVRVLDRIAAAVTAGNWTDPAREELHRNVYRLDDVVMLAQARVAALAAELPGQGSAGCICWRSNSASSASRVSRCRIWARQPIEARCSQP